MQRALRRVGSPVVSVDSRLDTERALQLGDTVNEQGDGEGRRTDQVPLGPSPRPGPDVGPGGLSLAAANSLQQGGRRVGEHARPLGSDQQLQNVRPLLRERATAPCGVRDRDRSARCGLRAPERAYS